MSAKTRTILSAACLFFTALSCNKGNESSDAEAKEKQAVAPVTEETEAVEDTDPKKDAGVQEPDAGDDPYREQIVLNEDTPANEILALVEQLQLRIQDIELREREVIQREQMVASLEEATMQQVAVLWKLKSQVEVLLDKVGEDFRDERKKYETKVKKEEAQRKIDEKKAAEERRKKAAELRQMAEEMTEERQQRIVQLAATIKGMRASAGAGMLASMDEKDAVAVLRQLGARQAAALLGNMPPEKAATLAESMLGPKPISPEAVDEASRQVEDADKAEANK